MLRQLQHLWGIFYRAVSFLERRFPRTFPGSPQGKHLSGNQQLRAIKSSINGTLKLAGVQVMPFDDSCAVCNSFAHQVYPVDAAPDIPLSNCPFGSQCKAIYAPVIDYGLLKVTQILTAQPNLRVKELRQLLNESNKENIEHR